MKFNLQSYYSRSELKNQYVFIAKKEKFFDQNGQVQERFKQVAIKVSNLQKHIEKIKDTSDLYVSVNTFKNKQRKNSKVQSYNAIFVDIDLNEGLMNNYNEALYVKSIIDEKINSKEMPVPSRVVFSGGGLHYYWYLEGISEVEFRILENSIINYFKGIDLESGQIDENVKDPARILRIPGSINTKEYMLCEVIEETDIYYTFEELVKYGSFTIRKNKGTKYEHKNVEKKQVNEKYVSNVKKFAQRTYKDIANVINYRTMNKINNIGTRELSFFLMRYYGLIATGDKLGVVKEMIKLNSNLPYPLDERELIEATSSASRAYSLYESQGIYLYRYKTITIIERLKITPEEQRHLVSLVADKKERKRRINRENYKESKKKNPVQYRSYTTLESYKTKLRIAKLYSRGYSCYAIAKKLNISKQYAYKVVNELIELNIIDKLTRKLNITIEEQFNEDVQALVLIKEIKECKQAINTSSAHTPSPNICAFL